MSLPVFDVVVVGAGISGIAAARFYLYIHPHCRLTILEKDTHLGGVWNARRSFEHFWTQWTVGTAEFSDKPMTPPLVEDTYFDTFKAKYTTQYLEEYVDEQIFASKNLRERIQFGFEVHQIEKLADKWAISGKDGANEAKTLRTSKLIVASGLTTVPNLPNLPNQDHFEGQIIHQSDFGQSPILSSPEITRVTILGGSKSSADMAYSAVKAGKSVSWIIREPGTGPGFFLAAKGIGPYKNAYAIGSTRIAASLSPSILGPENWWTRFLHGTSWGAKMVMGFWEGVNRDVGKVADFEGREGAKEGFGRLKPHTPIFWQNGSGGLINHPDFWETIAPNVQIYLDSIVSLDKCSIRLKSEEEVPADLLLLGTGWTPSLNFFSQEMLIELDLPHKHSASNPEKADRWSKLESEADEQVLAKFPALANPPTDYFAKPPSHTPYRLYNGMIPPSDVSSPSIVFIGHVLSANYFRLAEVQAIYATAYLDSKLSLPSTEEMEKEIALFTAWCKRRYLSNGQKGNWMVFELMWYTDKLLRECGLKSHRRGWWRDWFAPGTMVDLRGVGVEYVGRFGREEGERGD